ncbi:glycosyltransferase [Telmatocola sphagniphila]|uniref:Glycosyltransferase n=1 Tax=Telmatocola sphagniphila TaxID=1123043 RepID=A0A8E6B479_9BACT|nr:glycosyltransferase [Telmatocola sphagniphila]QVL31139.1 glycosyltransferase [Telmatocola sphagniphila]
MVVLQKTEQKPVTILDARVIAGSGGGPDKTIINSPRYLQSAGYRMLCAYMHSSRDAGFEKLRDKARDKQTELLSVHDEGPLDYRVVPRMLKICREQQVDIWHGHDYKTNALGLLLKRFHPMRLVTTLHGWVHNTHRTPLYYRIDQLTLRYYEKVICVSEDLYKLARQAGVPATRCELLENGIDLEDYKRRKSITEAKEELGFRTDRLLIGACGRLSAEKGFDILIAAVGHLLQNFPFVELAIVGEGEEKAKLEQIIRDWSLQDHVKLLGYRSDVPQLYEAFDIFALSSHREGLPNVVLEAMATEVPVVATAVNGVPKLIREGENGLLVRAGQVEDLREALQRLVEEASLRQRLGSRARQTVENEFSFAKRMDKLRRMYDRMLARK